MVIEWKTVEYRLIRRGEFGYVAFDRDLIKNEFRGCVSDSFSVGTRSDFFRFFLDGMGRGIMNVIKIWKKVCQEYRDAIKRKT